MRYLILLLCLVLFSSANGHRGFGLNNYSLLHGKTQINTTGNYHSVEFQFDKKIHGCLMRTNYKGYGLNYTFGDKYQSFGLKGMINPTKRFFQGSRKFIFHPYLLLQVNLVRENGTFNNYKNNICPGIGLNGVWRITRKINIRPQLQVRHNVNEEFLKNESGLRFDLRIGIGVDKFRFSKKENRYRK